VILFCDTSALVKLYIREAGSDEVRQVADAVQLASASRVRDRTGQTTGFACFDRRLNQAARILGLRVEMTA